MEKCELSRKKTRTINQVVNIQVGMSIRNRRRKRKIKLLFFKMLQWAKSGLDNYSLWGCKLALFVLSATSFFYYLQ